VAASGLLSEMLSKRTFSPEECYILNSVQDAVMVFDVESVILYVNDAYCRVFQVPREKIVGRKLKDIEPRAMGLEVLKTGNPVRNEYSYIESAQMDMVGDITPLFCRGKLVGAVAVMKEIKELFQINRKLAERKGPLLGRETKREKQLINSAAFQKLRGVNPRYQECLFLAARVAETDATILLRGETGVGKGVLAEAIHQASPRRDGPFVTINMAAIPDALLESELFGYEAGAFTGAARLGKKGKIEAAEGGTLFLDEIGEMSLSTQAKLLRVIQEKTVERIGSVKSRKIDVRIIAATNCDLEQMVEKGLFRADLYYRLNVVSIELPPLRERIEDLLVLAENFLRVYREKYQKDVVVPCELLERLSLYPWPGNIRELQNAVEHMVLLSRDVILTEADLPRAIKEWLEQQDGARPDASPRLEAGCTNLKQLTEEMEKRTIQYVLQSCENKSEAIKKLGISRRAFYEKMKKYGFL
jgi:PAS domain S-box-containing protein